MPSTQTEFSTNVAETTKPLDRISYKSAFIAGAVVGIPLSFAGLGVATILMTPVGILAACSAAALITGGTFTGIKYLRRGSNSPAP